jgi:hypothetical protein
MPMYRITTTKIVTQTYIIEGDNAEEAYEELAHGEYDPEDASYSGDTLTQIEGPFDDDVAALGGRSLSREET